MSNLLCGWLLLTQVAYVTIFALLVLADKLTAGSVFWATVGLRKALHLENTVVRLSDYLFVPLMGTVPFNLLLMLAFCATLLRSRRGPALTTDFFSILNALILTPCLLLLFAAFWKMMRH